MGCALAERQSKRGQRCAQFLWVRGDRPAHVEQRLSARRIIYRRFKLTNHAQRNDPVAAALSTLLVATRTAWQFRVMAIATHFLRREGPNALAPPLGTTGINRLAQATSLARLSAMRSKLSQNGSQLRMILPNTDILTG